MTIPKARSLDRKFLLRLLGTLLTLILLVYLLRNQSWQEISEAIQDIPLWRFGLALIMILCSRLAIGIRWHVLVRTVESKMTIGQTLRLTFAGLFASNFLPTTIGGDVARLAGAVQLQYDAVNLTASLVIDRLVGMTGMALALPFAFPNIERLSLIGHLAPGPDHPFYISVSFLGIAIPKGFKQLWSKLVDALRRFGAVLMLWLARPKVLLEALTFSWIHMVCWFGSIYVLLGGMGESTSFWSIAGMWSIVYFITLLPVSINGLGLQELSITFLFTTLGGIAAHSSVIAAIFIRTLSLLASLPGALFIPGIMAGKTSTDHNQENPRT